MYGVIMTVFAQIAIMIRFGHPLEIEADSLRLNMVIWHRVYAVTGRNKLLCAPLVLLILAQVPTSIYGLTLYMAQPRKSFNVCSLAYEFISL